MERQRSPLPSSRLRTIGARIARPRATSDVPMRHLLGAEPGDLGRRWPRGGDEPDVVETVVVKAAAVGAVYARRCVRHRAGPDAFAR